MLQIPIQAVPQQSLNAVVAGQNVSISLYTLADQWGTNLYADVTNGATVLRTAVRCLNLGRWLVDCGYLGFVGDFAFVDTQGNSDPQASGLGSRFLLMYLEASDLVGV
jgi:hypothetical protein